MTKKKKPVKARIRLWVQALRSGKYKQGRGQLKDGNAFCCLGVATDLYVKAKHSTWKHQHFLFRGLARCCRTRLWIGWE